ncbi:hypothetical protein MAR_005160 [Mya arenaria]|uniref:Uncharacterized protein n=1 Tax=Mya arenaria TaxID=6604 RepID=A0ABY7F0B7_MYAAR|nr:hypothetical protein MAR_005160 [Mya arenaria]
MERQKRGKEADKNIKGLAMVDNEYKETPCVLVEGAVPLLVENVIQLVKDILKNGSSVWLRICWLSFTSGCQEDAQAVTSSGSTIGFHNCGIYAVNFKTLLDFLLDYLLTGLTSTMSTIIHSNH